MRSGGANAESGNHCTPASTSTSKIELARGRGVEGSLRVLAVSRSRPIYRNYIYPGRFCLSKGSNSVVEWLKTSLGERGGEEVSIV